jgi:adenosine 3'-phospho 5'-phosphosulfate transporter B3
MITNNSFKSTTPFIVLFFTAMIVHEIALESITAVYSLSPYDLPHLATSVTLFQFMFCVILPFGLSVFSSNGDVVQNLPRSCRDLLVYVQLSAVVYGATAFATMSLSYEGVTYVTKVVFKSAKLIPTMLVGAIIEARAARRGRIVNNKKKYGAWEYSSALLLCVGAAGFCISPENEENESEATNDKDQMESAEATSEGLLSGHIIGLSLLTASVFCDALVPNIQEKLMHGTAPERPYLQHHDSDVEMKPFMESVEKNSLQQPVTQGGLSSMSLLVNTNLVGFTILLLTNILSSSLVSILSNMIAHPHYLLLLLTVGVGLGTAVLAYTELIRRSGPAVAVAIATLRKVVTVVLSYIIFPKALSSIHLISAGLVLLGLFIGFVGKGKK